MRFAVTLLLMLACAPHESPPPPAPKQIALQEFRGTYVVGDERIAFEACGEGQWWVQFTPEARRQLEQFKISGWGRWPMRVRGTLSKKGRYGHLGMYSRTLTVEQVIERVNVGCP